MTFEEARAQFPVLARFAYLNAGTFGPLASTTAEALELHRRRDLEEGRSGAGYWESLMEASGAASRAARLDAGRDARDVALTGSTTDGATSCSAGSASAPATRWSPPTSSTPACSGRSTPRAPPSASRTIEERPADEAFDAILAEVTPRTKLLALSHVAWSTGNVLPIAELKPETGVPILVDGAQSVGAIDVDAAAFDYYTVSGQKWLCGPEGTGALYVADPERLRLASPTSFAFVHDDDPSLRPKPGAAGSTRAGWARARSPGSRPRSPPRPSGGSCAGSSRPAARESGSPKWSTSSPSGHRRRSSAG